MSFFIRGRRREVKEKKGKKRGLKNKQVLPVKKSKFDSGLDEEITSDEEEEYLKGKVNDIAEEKEAEDVETAQEKKVRLAREYIQELRREKENEDDEELDDKAVAARLQEEVLESAGKLRRLVAETYLEPDSEDFTVLKSKHQKLPITCLTVTSDGKFIFSGSKDCSIVKYSIEGKRLGHIPGGRKGTENLHTGHTSHIYSLAVSTDGRFLASGDKGGFIHIWNGETLEHLKKFKSHRDAVSALTFRRSSHTLYSASYDRMVMVWDLDTMAFVEHLGGHQDAITGIDSLARESCITSGGRDQSVIVYVIVEDKQLRFVSPHESVDGVKLVDERTFVTFGQEGSLGIWTTLKKRPHYMIKKAHGCQAENGLPNWICSVTTLVNTDLVASGSMDGHVRLWKITVDRGQRKLEPLFSIPIPGVVNALAFTSDGSHLIIGIGQEHKLGRWFKDKRAKNSIVVIPMKKNV
ncbi:U3 small nucleolar RNA-interacting protein 2-like [Macrobrachium rosenbergii]|uniref:U3 small nucleolar RNA-interacting protein 2-like n=1 Tax=Macrobrachium rosenbergii TaxID=79674 RepID=UPI0034D4AFA2